MLTGSKDTPLLSDHALMHYGRRVLGGLADIGEVKKIAGWSIADALEEYS